MTPRAISGSRCQTKIFREYQRDDLESAYFHAAALTTKDIPPQDPAEDAMFLTGVELYTHGEGNERQADSLEGIPSSCSAASVRGTFGNAGR